MDFVKFPCFKGRFKDNHSRLRFTKGQEGRRLHNVSNNIDIKINRIDQLFAETVAYLET
jgi:hypothetical protein